jgi:hypothetical protein
MESSLAYLLELEESKVDVDDYDEVTFELSQMPFESFVGARKMVFAKSVTMGIQFDTYMACQLKRYTYGGRREQTNSVFDRLENGDAWSVIDGEPIAIDEWEGSKAILDELKELHDNMHE